MKRIRRTGPDKETINVCYVIDDWRHLIGVLSIRTLLLAEEDDIIGDIMERNYICVQTLDDQEETARALGKYDFLALPVVDTENRLVGIVTVDDAMDVLQEEVTEDMEKMAAMLPTDKPYLRTSAFDTFKSRIPWLLLLMVSATFTGQIISSFEDALSAFTILTAYIPMLMDTGGNCGSPGQRHGDPRPVSGRDRIFRPDPGGLEGVPGGAAVRHRSGRSQLRQADAAGPDGIPQSHYRHRSRRHLPDAGVHRVRRQDRRLYAAAAG